MCGIFGNIGDLSKDRAMKCLNTLAHRGPDGEGLFQENDVTLGHRRLSILDLSEGGRQPMAYANERFWITFNGEIYNFLEIKAELEIKGYSFRSASDTEVILAAFQEWREDCLDRFNGMWALAIWDRRDRSLFLSRDRFGKKPLFYGFLKAGFAFASEMKALFPLMGQVTPNYPLVADRSRIFQYESTEECVIEGIKRFPAGHFGWYKDGSLKITRWWNTLDHLQNVPSRYEEQVEQFRALFFDACRLRMRSDVPIGTALSGGLDSSATISAVAHLARNQKTERMNSDWQHAFVATFPGTPMDEQNYARKVAEHLGIKATYIEINPLKAIDRLQEYFRLFEDLYITSPIPFMLTYAEVKAKGISVTLDGHGADELFGGYSFDFLEALRDSEWNFQQAYQIINTFYESGHPASPQFQKLPSKSWFLMKWHLKSVLKKLNCADKKDAFKDPMHPRWIGLDHLSRQLYRSTHETVLPTLLRNYDRYSMANGVEIRMPFMDHRVVTFAFSIPWTSKIRNGFSKAIVRDAIAPYMPREIAYRKTKIGFNSPVVDWMKGPLKPFLMDTIESRSFKECALINFHEVGDSVRFVMNNPKARFSDGERAWTLLSLYFWDQAVIKNKEKEPVINA